MDAILKERKTTGKKPPRASVQRVNLGHTHNRIPTGTLWPFMVSQDWYDTNIDGDKELEASFKLYTQNPEGFGDDGDDYAGDDEGKGSG